MIAWFLANRLKVASFCALMGDFLMGLTGGVNVFNPSAVTSTADVLLVIGGTVGLFGHFMLMAFGKGGRIKNAAAIHRAHTPPLLRAFFPWRYPLDTAFALFVCSGLLYMSVGIAWALWSLIIIGIFVATGSAIGWLYPQDRTICGVHTIRVTASLYMCASILTYLAAWQQQSVLLLLAGLAYTACNTTLYFVRKENQSVYSQMHD